MYSPVKAIIFDMDGVIIDSEPLWRKAMVSGFSRAGMSFSDEDCRKTTGMRFKEVTEIWLKHHKITHIGPTQLENEVLDLLIDLINTEGKIIDGVLDLFDHAKKSNLKIGLATSSSHRLMDAVLKKLDLQTHFDAAVSAEFMTHGKPHPEVFLMCANKLQINPNECVVIEDSVNGVIAAKAAQMRVIAVPDAEHKYMKGFGAADHQHENMREVLMKFKELLNHKTA